MIASGPSFRQAFQDSLPTSNVDITPTVLHMHHLQVPAAMDGRVLSELLKEPSAPTNPAKHTVIETAAKGNGWVYKLRLYQSAIGKYRCLDYTQVERLR